MYSPYRFINQSNLKCLAKKKLSILSVKNEDLYINESGKYLLDYNKNDFTEYL